MLTQQELDALARLSQEELLKLWVLARQARAEMRGSGCMPPSAVQDLVKAVGDKQVRDIVNDLRSGRAEPGFIKPGEKVEMERGSGWQKPIPLSGPPGVAICDQMMDVQDRIDRVERAKGFGSAGLGGPKVVTKDEAK
jgi:hypothetical protein